MPSIFFLQLEANLSIGERSLEWQLLFELFLSCRELADQLSGFLGWRVFQGK